MEYINVFLYLLLFIILYRRKCNKIAVLATGIWLLSAVIGLIYVQMPEPIYKNALGHDLSFAPFLYLFICFFVFLLPLLSNKEDIRVIYTTKKHLLYPFLWVLSVCALFPFGESVFHLIRMVITGQFMTMAANYDEINSGDVQAFQVSYISNRILVLLICMKFITPILFFYVYQNVKESKYLKIGLFIASITPAVFNLCNGGRVQMVFITLYYVALYLLFSKTLNEKSRQLLKKTSFYLFIVIGVVFISMTIGRFVLGDKFGGGSAMDFIFQYTSEGMFNFDNSMYYVNKTTDGLATSWTIMKHLGLTDSLPVNYVEFMTGRLGIPGWWFYTYIGDLYSDFGFIGTLLWIFIFAFVFSLIRLQKKMNIADLFLYSIYLHIVVNGLFYYPHKMSFEPIYAGIIFFLLFKINLSSDYYKIK